MFFLVLLTSDYFERETTAIWECFYYVTNKNGFYIYLPLASETLKLIIHLIISKNIITLNEREAF